MNAAHAPFRPWILLALAGLLCACDPGVEVLNVSPEVVAIGPISMAGDELEIVVWLRDHEEDAVYASLTVLHGGAEIPLVPAGGGHGTAGLTTSRAPEGEPHPVRWLPEGLLPGDRIRIRVQVTDAAGGSSDAVESPELTLEEGLLEPFRP